MINCKICKALSLQVKWESDTLLNITTIINRFVNEGKLIKKDEQDVDSLFPFSSYYCKECSATWKLTYPDHAFIGGFKRYVFEAKKNDDE